MTLTLKDLTHLEIMDKLAARTPEPAVETPKVASLKEKLIILSSKLRQRGFERHAEGLEENIFSLKDPLYNTIDETGDELLHQAHPDGDVELFDNQDDLGDIETLPSMHEKIMEAVIEPHKKELVLAMLRESLGLNKKADVPLPPVPELIVPPPAAPAAAVADAAPAAFTAELAAPGTSSAVAAAGGTAAETGAAAAGVGAGAAVGSIALGAIIGGAIGYFAFDHFYNQEDLVAAGNALVKEASDYKGETDTNKWSIEGKAQTAKLDALLKMVPDAAKKSELFGQQPTIENYQYVNAFMSLLRQLNTAAFKLNDIATGFQEKNGHANKGILNDIAFGGFSRLLTGYSDIMTAANNFLKRVNDTMAIYERALQELPTGTIQAVNNITGLLNLYRQATRLVVTLKARVIKLPEATEMTKWLNTMGDFIKKSQAEFAALSIDEKVANVGYYINQIQTGAVSHLLTFQQEEFKGANV